MSSASADDFRPLLRLAQAIEPYLDEVVLVGGWAHRLFPFSRAGADPGFALLATEDADLAVRENLAVVTAPLHDLLTEAGFEPDYSGSHTPPVTHYVLPDEDGFYVELLTPFVGGRIRKARKVPVTVEIAGAVAQKLRCLDLLLESPWNVDLPSGARGRQTQRTWRFRIANPVMYLVQKHLALEKRKPREQPKDVLYIHDTLQIFADALDDLRLEWLSLRPVIEPAWQRAFHKKRVQLFSGAGGVVREAHAIARSAGRALPANAIALACREGLERIFGEDDHAPLELGAASKGQRLHIGFCPSTWTGRDPGGTRAVQRLPAAGSDENMTMVWAWF